MTPERLAEISAEAYQHMTPWSAKGFADTLESRFALLVTQDQAFVLGQVIVDEAEVLALATHPAAQGQGLASQTLTGFLSQAQERGATRVFLEVAAANTPARALYEKHGFSVASVRKAYYARPQGRKDDALLMTRALP